jgi:hypothetical protein
MMTCPAFMVPHNLLSLLFEFHPANPCEEIK